MTQALAMNPSFSARAADGRRDTFRELSARALRVLGVRIFDVSKAEAIETMRRWIDDFDGRARRVFIVNAHTLNLAWEDESYRGVLNAADAVFADGTGVRLAARLHGCRLKDNLVGTDLLPAFLARHQHRYRFFLLGGSAETAARAAHWLDGAGAHIAGHHHGFANPSQQAEVIDRINASRADLLLVGMGNPLQERWIHHSLPSLQVPVSIGVGGLFDYWAGHLPRAPLWVRKLGVEWCHILIRQPYKWRRYLLGNPKFVARAIIDARGRRSMPGPDQWWGGIPREGGSTHAHAH